MNIHFTINPNQLKQQTRMIVNSDKYGAYTGAYIGAYTYCLNMHMDNSVEFTAGNGLLLYNVQIGKYNSIGNNLECVLARNHNYRMLSTGAVALMLKENHIELSESDSTFNNKGNIIIQNDVWFGENVTVMGGVTVRNGAVIARNSHVVADVPPYAVVGGNPAKIIGYRYTEKQIRMLQRIAWWDWENTKIVENAAYFTEDVDRFCSMFYEEAERKFEKYVSERRINDDSYFLFVDFYENYGAYTAVLKSFIQKCFDQENKKLILFVRDDHAEGTMKEDIFNDLKKFVHRLNDTPGMMCSVEIRRGDFDDSKKCFLNCSHYIVSRTYDAVFFSCLADQLGMEMISGVDSSIQF